MRFFDRGVFHNKGTIRFGAMVFDRLRFMADDANDLKKLNTSVFACTRALWTRTEKSNPVEQAAMRVNHNPSITV